ncbi:MAG: sigma-54-dependent Fis family transcriptional regulator [Candidatus Riflebacteria bacterium]|nr:sigma-54-dependent Fis family transcriptional regulator [Candidatus Riflebacteria bacterium]
MARILFADDDQTGREVARYHLTEAGYEVDAVGDGQQAIELFSEHPHDLVVADLKMPGATGLEILAHVKKLAREVPVVVITAHGSVETAISAMKGGAYDFIEKPFKRDVLLLVVLRALQMRSLALENRTLRRKVLGVERDIVVSSKALLRLLESVDKVAQSEATILITGESGSGKELIARRLHIKSLRADGPFVAVNCAAMPGELLETELFGHEKGAYTGATKARLGRFRTAEGGTLFLDEIAELPLTLQAKLLRTLQERVIDVVGSDQPVAVNVRVVAATNQPLAERIEAGTFRKDLYYRLNVVEIQVPPLRDRIEDVAALARHFVHRLAAGRELSIPEEVLSALQRYSWPGNVRELENACERLVLLCDGDTLRVEDLPPAIGKLAAGPSNQRGTDLLQLPPEGLSLMDLERRVIESALLLKKGNVTQTAAYLRIPRHVLAYRIEKFGIRRG